MPEASFALYVAGYTAGRFAFELMRSDYANLILGLRVNTWVAALIFLAGAAGFVLLFRRGRSVAIPAAAGFDVDAGTDAGIDAARQPPSSGLRPQLESAPRGHTDAK